MLNMMQNPRFAINGGLRQAGKCVSTFDAMDRLGAVRVPTLVLAGDQDILTPHGPHGNLQRPFRRKASDP